MVDFDFLQQFCASPNDVKEDIKSPFTFDKHVIATNTHIFIRVPKNSVIDIRLHAGLRPTALLKKLAELEKQSKELSGFSLADFDKPELEKCDCREKFEKEKENPKRACLECEGSGGASFDNGFSFYDFTCETCGGVGKVDKTTEEKEKQKELCFECDEEGWARNYGQGSKNPLIQVGPAWFNPWYLSLVCDLPDLMFYPTIPDGPAYYGFQGGDGLLMPCREPEKR